MKNSAPSHLYLMREASMSHKGTPIFYGVKTP